MKEKSLVDQVNSSEHLKFEITQECGLKRKADKKCKKNIKNS
ncbi:MAG: hypothetical protein WBK78_03780 [Syntrophomonadaceae bacterium]